MWKVDTICASDDKGNFICLIKGTLTLYVATDSLHISKKIEIKETPPCLSVAIDDLLKVLAKTESI